MEVKRVAGLSEEEKAVLVQAGQILGSFNKAFESGEVDLLSEETKSLIAAVADVATKVKDR